TPIPDASFAVDWFVGIMTPGPGGWVVAKSFGERYANVASLELWPLPGNPAVAFYAGVGAHAARLVAVRWDGSGWASLFDGGSTSPGIDAEDLDGAGVPEIVSYWSPYCESYAASPHLVSVDRWDGTAFVDATGRYPQLVAKAAAGVREAFARAAQWSAT